MVERRWRAACKSENESLSVSDDKFNDTVLPSLPTDFELAAAYLDRKSR